MIDCIETLTKDYDCTITFLGLDKILVYYQGTEFSFPSWEEVIKFQEMLVRSTLIDKND